MQALERIEIERACEQLSIAYARHVDFKEYDRFAELFTEDGHLNAGGLIEGRAAIRQRMEQRPDRLRSRHVLTNIHVEVIDADHARGITYLSLYRHVGDESLAESPIELAGRAAVGHYEDEFVRTASGWRIAPARAAVRVPPRRRVSSLLRAPWSI
jgi:hypothetical protein